MSSTQSLFKGIKYKLQGSMKKGTTSKVNCRFGQLEIWTFEILIIIIKGDLNAPINDMLVKLDLIKVGLQADNLTICQDVAFDLEG